MSTIIALKDNDIVHLISDSQTSAGDNKANYIKSTNHKIFKPIGINNCLIAKVGIVNQKSVLSTIDFELSDINEITYDIVVKRIIPKISSSVKDFGHKTYEDDGDFGSSFLIVQRDKIFFVDGDLSATEVIDFMAIGIGYAVATGSVITNDYLEPKQRLINALSIVSKLKIGVGSPFIYYNTKDMIFEIIEEEK